MQLTLTAGFAENLKSPLITDIVSGFPELAQTEYISQHNKTAAYIHWKICRGYEIEKTEKWYEHQPTTITENSEVTILWDMPVQTDREIQANRPDIVVKDKKRKKVHAHRHSSSI